MVERERAGVRVGGLELWGVGEAYRREGNGPLGGYVHGGDGALGPGEWELGGEGVGTSPGQLGLERLRLAPGGAVEEGQRRRGGEGFAFSVGVEVELDRVKAGLHPLGDEHVLRELVGAADGPAGEAGVEVAQIPPVADGAGELAVGLAGVAEDASEAGLPGGDDGGFVFVEGDGGEAGAFAEVTEVVAAEGGWAPERAAGEGGEPGGGAEGGGLVQEGAAGDDEGVLGEEAGEFFGLVGEIDLASAEAGDVVEELGVLVDGGCRGR